MRTTSTKPFSEVMFEFHNADLGFRGLLCDAGCEDFERISGDCYDWSLEMLGVGTDVRLTAEQQKIIFDAGFEKVYVNHKDGWETHYTWGKTFTAQRGWRRRYVADSTATTTNVVAGEPNPGYYEISYWPDCWTQKEWLTTGYMRIVPDPLDSHSHSGGE